MENFSFHLVNFKTSMRNPLRGRTCSFYVDWNIIWELRSYPPSQVIPETQTLVLSATVGG